MATNYPSGLDSLSNPAGSDALSTGHASQHANANDAIEAIEGELGLNPRGGSATVKARFDAIEANSWVTSARIADGTITGTDIASGTVTSTNILDGTIVNADINASAAIDVTKLSGVVASATVGNMLSVNQASLEDGTATGWSILAASLSALVASTDYAAHGTYSLKATANSTSQNRASTEFGKPSTLVAGQTYTFYALARSNQASGEVARVDIIWGEAGTNNLISTSAGTSTAIGNTGWTVVTNTAVAPATTGWARIDLNRYSGVSGAITYWDKIGFWQGAGGLWALPGTPIANLGTYTDESVGRRIFTWDTVNARWQMTYGDTGLRDITASMSAISGVTWNYMFARRIGPMVEIRGKMTTTGAISSSTAYVPPAGFNYHPSLSDNHWTGFRAVGSIDTAMLATVAGATLNFSASAAGLYAISCVYSTNDAWPTALPGTASGAIPQ